MPSSFIARSSEGALSFLLRTRARRVLLLAVGMTLYLLGLVYHLGNWITHAPASPAVGFLYELNVLACYGVLWLLLSHYLRHRVVAPIKTLWSTLFFGLLLLGFGYVLFKISQPPNLAANPTMDVQGFALDTNVPLALFTVIKMNLLSLLEAAFAFFLLLRFRDLVLFKRTRTSQRNWYLMIGMMALTALTAWQKSPRTENDLLQILPMVVTIGFMVVNAFRLSWIVYLSFKEKMATSGLALLLTILLLNLWVGDDSVLPYGAMYLDVITFYSYPLSLFVNLSFVFGIVYCITAFLSLLFHLPTTGDFQRKVDEMSAMHSLTHLVSQFFDPEKLFATILTSPIETGSAHAAWLAVADPQSGSLRPRIVATHKITLEQVNRLVDSEALYDEVVGTRAPLLLDEAAADHRVAARPGDGLGSLLVMPLVARDEVLGALFVTKEVTLGFEKDDVEAIGVFAAQAALALDNARLFEERLEKERLTRELSIAREVQRRLLPQRLPHLEGVTLAASSVSAQEVGGDYYDYLKLDDHRLAVIIADVSGKGTSAAFYMAELQGIFHSVSRLTASPVEFLSLANDALAESLDKNVFISVIYGVLDLQKEEFVLARAGHCPAAFIDLNGEARYLRSRGMGLGLDRSGRFRQMLMEDRIRLQPGDVLVLYTDGVVESRNEAGEEYGYDRLLCALREHRHEDAPELHAALLSHLDGYLGHRHYDDDMTLLVLKWHGINLPRHIPAAEATPQRAPNRAESLLERVQEE